MTEEPDAREHAEMVAQFVRDGGGGGEIRGQNGEQIIPEQPAETSPEESNSFEVPKNITDWSIEKHNEIPPDKDVDDHLLAINANRSYEQELETKQSELAKRRRVGGFASWLLGKKR
jgi:hypothetical protein